MFEHALWGIFQTTRDGQYIRANPALALIYGYETPAALMTGLTDIGRQLYVDPTRRTEFVRLMQENGALSGFESEIYRSDGSIIWISERVPRGVGRARRVRLLRGHGRKHHRPQADRGRAQ